MNEVTDVIDPHYLQRWVVLAIGCAECNEEPLVIPKGTFDSEDEALASTGIDDPNVFGVHPDGGVIFQTRSGAVWIFPIEVLATVSTAEGGVVMDQSTKTEQVTRREWLMYCAILDGAPILHAPGGVALLTVLCPELDMAETRTWAEWEEGQWTQ